MSNPLEEIERRKGRIALYVRMLLPLTILLWGRGWRWLLWLREIEAEQYNSTHIKVVRWAVWVAIVLGISIAISPFLIALNTFGRIAVLWEDLFLLWLVALVFFPGIAVYAGVLTLLIIKEKKKVYSLEQKIGIIHEDKVLIQTKEDWRNLLIALAAIFIITITTAYISTIL